MEKVKNSSNEFIFGGFLLKEPGIIVVIPARNEKKNIIKTLDALSNQSFPPNIVIVVDDGSSDDTLQILREYRKGKFKLIIKTRSNRRGGRSLVGTPAIATTFNVGFKEAKKHKYKYIMVLGADTILEMHYIEKLLIKFSENTSLAIASGQSKQMAINPNHARGSGRLIDYRFWKQYGEEYPVIYGWEDDCLIQCRRIGLKVGSFAEIRFLSTRKDQGTIDFVNWGRAARAMGYHPIITGIRALNFVIFQKYGIIASVRFFAGYLLDPIPEEIKQNQALNRMFLRQNQVRTVFQKLYSRLKRI